MASVRFLSVGLLTACLLNAATAHSAQAQEPPLPAVSEQALEDWRAMRFGMFIHWGPVSLKGTEIGWSRGVHGAAARGAAPARCRCRTTTTSTGSSIR